jgi:hypothetical protein
VESHSEEPGESPGRRAGTVAVPKILLIPRLTE